MSQGLWVLLGVFTLAAVLGAPLGLSMLAAGFVYLISTHQDVGLVVDQTMNGLYNSYLLIAVPMFIFVANVMNASGVIERLLKFGAAMVGHLPGRARAGERRHQPDLLRHERQRGRGRVRSRPDRSADDDPERPLSAGLCRGDIGRVGDARAADADVDPDDLLCADRQCFGRRHVPWRAGSGRHHGAVDDDRDRHRVAPPQLPARAADDLAANAGRLRAGTVADRAAGHPARTDLFRRHRRRPKPRRSPQATRSCSHWSSTGRCACRNSSR